VGNLAARLVELCRRYALAVAIFYLALAVGAGYLAATQLSIDTDLDKLISSKVPWRQQERALDEAFPQNSNLLAIVIDGKTPDETSDATAALAGRLEQQPDLFKSVHIPGSGEYFARNGLLFLPTAEVQNFADQLISAQPLLGTAGAWQVVLASLAAALTMAWYVWRTHPILQHELRDTPLGAVPEDF